MRAWAIGIGLLWATAALRAEPPPLREARSENGQFTLRLEPGRSGRDGRSCEATLFERSDRGVRPQRVWERPLVNDVAPVQAAVRNDGRFVITLDEHRRGGARHAVVIYGPRGELLRHFLLPDLLAEGDWGHVRREGRELIWLTGARFRFDDAADEFVIELSGTRRIRIDLKTLRVVREDAAARVGPAPVPAEFLALLFDASAAGGDEAESAGRPPGAALSDRLTGLTAAEQARTSAIASALTPGETSATVDSPAGAPETTRAQATGADAPAGRSAPERPTTDAGSGPAADEWPAWRAPAPNLAAKTDYVAWLNQLGRVSGADATPLYDAAIAGFNAWTGDAALLSAAERGEQAALTSPELAAWLAANADALEKFRAATRLPHRSWHRRSDDGTLFGVVLPELGPLRTLARTNLTDGRRLLAEGRPTEALQRYVEVSAAGAHVAQGTTLIEGLVGMAMQRQAGDAVLDLVRDPRAEKADFAAIADALETSLGPPPPMTRALEGERAFFMDAAQRVWDIDPQTGARVVNRARAREFLAYAGEGDPQQLEALVSDLDATSFEETVAVGNAFFDATTLALARPYHEAAALLEEVESVAAGARSNPFLRRLTPAMSRYNLVWARGEATRRAAVLLANLRAFRQAKGEYPATLDDFAASPFAQDPFRAQPFVYQRRGDDFVLYSVGGDGTDAGGVHDDGGEINDLRFWPPP